jgi:hypothetical protein
MAWERRRTSRRRADCVIVGSLRYSLAGDALSTILLDLNRWALKWIDLPADQ